MLIVYSILLYLYICLILLYLFTTPQPLAISPWGILPLVPEALKPIVVSCQVDSDCESNHVCLGSTCVRKLLRGGKCDRVTGYWVSYQMNNATFAVCVCHDHQLYTQKFFGGDCNVSVACGVHGKYNPATKACHCDDHYRPVGLSCQKVPVLEYKNRSPCAPDELPVANTDLAQEGFHADYIARLQASKTRCVKRPCSFDALTGRPLKVARYEKDWGCVCDPRFGLFGVALDGYQKHYLTSPGFDACASIFVAEPSHPIGIQYVTYFYLKDRNPVSIILFENLKKNYLTPFFKKDPFMITQSLWRYDFAQRFFVENASVRTRTRKYKNNGYFQRFSHTMNHVYKDDFKPSPCHEVYDILKSGHTPLRMADVYRLLYAHPVCKVASDDGYAHPMFRDRVVLNPHHLTFDEHDTLPYFNAFVLKFEAGVLNRWTLDLDFAYDIDKYKAFRTNAPDYSDPVPPHANKPSLHP